MQGFLETEADLRMELEGLPEEKREEVEAQLKVVEKTIKKHGYWCAHFLSEGIIPFYTLHFSLKLDLY